MLRQLSAMVAKMGDLVGAADSGSAPPSADGGDPSGSSRPVVRAVAKNASDLIGVLCSESNAPLFLRYEKEDGTEGGAVEADDAAAAAKTEDNGGGNDGVGGGGNDGDDAAQQAKSPAPAPTTVKADDISGPLAALLTSCAITLPTQTPSHAALTLGVDVSSPSAYGGFAARCIHLLTRRFGSDLDAALGLMAVGGDGDGDDESSVSTSPSSSDDAAASGENLSGNGWDGIPTIPVDAYVRAKLALRYLALMGRVGVLAGYDAATDAAAFAGSATDGHTIAGLLNLLLEAADRAADAAAHPPSTPALSDGEVRAQSKSYRHASIILLSLVLSTVPYVVSYLPRDYVEGTLLSRVDSLLAVYESTYRPGVGLTALLLDGPQVEDKVAGAAAIDDEDEDDEDEEDEDGEDDDGSGVCCDTLQDLARTVKAVVTAHYDSDDDATTKGTLAGTCFALPADAPWSDLTIEPSPAVSDGDAMEDGGGAQRGAAYSGEPLRIMSLTAGPQARPISRAAPYLLALGDSSDQDGQVFLRIPNLDGIVYGRLAVFGLGDDEEDEDDEEDNQAQSNPEQDAYTNGFGLLDRCFLSEAVRDALVCHRPTVTATGAERGSCRDVAEQVMAIGHLFVPQHQSPAEDNGGGDSSMVTSSDAGSKSAKGFEYGIVETILSLIVQANKRREGSDVSGSPLGHLYLSRVLLEMTKLQPTLMPRAIVAAISALFEDFLPSLVPSARTALADWLALHLTNTSYQWPSSYWTHWTPYAQAFVGSSQRNSRGEFVMETLRDMIELQGSPDTLVSDCLPAGSPLVNLLLPNKNSAAESGDSLHAVAKDLEERIWIHNDDPDALREYIVGDEVQESISGSIGDSTDAQIWWRTSVVVKAILQPAKKDLDRALKAVQKACDKLAGGDDGDFMEEEDLDEATEDVVVDAVEAIGRYKPVVLAAMARDLQVYEEGQALSDLNESDMLLMGEIQVLRQTEAMASYSQSVLEAYVGALVQNRVVTPMAILKWVLGESDVPGAGGTTSRAPSVHASWYQYALQAVRMAASMELSDDGIDGGMIIDRSGEDENDGMNSGESAAIQRTNKAISAVTPLLKYASVRVCNILASTDEHDRKKVRPLEADLIDGLKMLVSVVPSQMRSILTNDKTLVEGATDSKPSTIALAKDIESCLAKSSISDLSIACREECTSLTRFVELVLRFLEA